MARENTMTAFGNGKKFLKGMKDAGSISSTLMGWYLSVDNNTQSVVQIGGYSSSYIKSGATLVDFTLNSGNFFWEFNLSGFRVGTSNTFSDGTTSAFYTDATEFIIDTGTTLLYTPSGYASSIVSLLTSGISSTTMSGYTVVRCSSASSMKSFFIYVQGYYLEVTPTTYLLDAGTTATDGSKLCIVGIMDGSSTYWLGGDIFIKNFFSVWDDDNNKISFAPHAYTTATITAGTIPTVKFTVPSGTNMSDLISSIAQVALVSVAVYLVSTYVWPYL
jgi:hypothetical protein